jgi:hypothetical protein
MQNSTRRDSKVAYPRQHIPRLEEEWLLTMAPRKSYAYLSFSVFASIYPFPYFAAGAGKSIIWCTASRLPL